MVLKPLVEQYIYWQSQKDDPDQSEVAEIHCKDISKAMHEVWDADIKNVFEEMRKETWKKIRNGELDLREELTKKQEERKNQKEKATKLDRSYPL